MLTVYGRATSSNVQALIWGLEELGLTYRRLDYGEVFGGLEDPDFQAMTPHRRIPVLKDGDTALWETPAILRYVATAYGRDPFWPRDPLARAQVDMWAEWVKHAVVTQFNVPLFWRVARTRAENRDHALIAANLARLIPELQKVETQLNAHTYLCGEELTLADIQLGHILYRYFDIEIDHPDLPALHRYYTCLAKRPAYRRCVMVSYDTLRNTF